MKRVLAVLMLVALILCAGCGGKTETTEEKLKQQLPELLENELEIEGMGADHRECRLYPR